MQSDTFRGRRAVSIENAALRVTVLVEGGHLAQVLDKQSGVNPLWTPNWPSIEPSGFGPAHHSLYGRGSEARLLAGIMGHNLCLDIFGGPSDEEFAAGLTAHGEAPIVEYEIAAADAGLRMSATLPQAHLRISRSIRLHHRCVRIRESVENLSGCDRPVGWTQHVTLGPPFLQHGATLFRASATRSKVFETTFGSADYLAPAAEFEWPHAPRRDGRTADLRVYTSARSSGAFTTHLMDPRRDYAYFVAWTPDSDLAFGYVWRTRDFPWMGIWEENRSRTHPPWNGSAVTRGMEFGVSPFPESRRQMIDRGRLFDVPAYRWIPARQTVAVEYWIVTARTSTIPELLDWPDGSERDRSEQA